MDAENRTADFGFIGLGAMGHHMAKRLISAGRSLAVFDVMPSPVEELVAFGATACSSPKEVASSAPVVFASLPSPASLVSVIQGDQGVLEGTSIQIFVDLSTSGPPTAEAMADTLGARGIGYVDAPVSGGTRGAENGTLAVMASGSPAAVESVRGALEVFGTLFVVGETAGQGQVVKIANNMLSATAIAVTGEVVSLAVKAGLNPATVLDVFNSGSGRNTASADKFPRAVLTRTFDVGFRLSLMAKDVRLCVAEAERRHVPLLLGSAISQMWSLAEAQLPEGVDCTQIVEMIESWAGTSIVSQEAT